MDFKRTCCAERPAEFSAPTCAAPARPSEEPSHAPCVPPPYTPGTWPFHMTRSKTPSPADGAVERHMRLMWIFSFKKRSLKEGLQFQGISSSLWWICGGSFYLVSSYSPCPRGWGRTGAGTPWRRWPTPGRCSRPACCTPGLAAGLPWGWWWRNCSARPPRPSLARWRSVCTLGRTASETGEGCSSVDICARGTI